MKVSSKLTLLRDPLTELPKDVQAKAQGAKYSVCSSGNGVMLHKWDQVTEEQRQLVQAKRWSVYDGNTVGWDISSAWGEASDGTTMRFDAPFVSRSTSRIITKPDPSGDPAKAQVLDRRHTDMNIFIDGADGSKYMVRGIDQGYPTSSPSAGQQPGPYSPLPPPGDAEYYDGHNWKFYYYRIDPAKTDGAA